MSGLGSLDLGKQVGPLPMGAWVAVVGAGLGYGYYSRKKNAAASVATNDPQVDTSVPAGVGTGAVGGYVDNTTATPSTTAPTITTNTDWGTAATNYLIAQNYDPALSDSAIRKYLASAPLSVTEYALIKVALLKFGPPPERLAQLPPAPPVVNAPAPPPAPAPAPPRSVPGPVAPPPPPPAPAPVAQHVYYTVRPGDSLSRIAARYPQAWITWQSIYNNNRALIGGNPNLIHPGQVLMIY